MAEAPEAKIWAYTRNDQRFWNREPCIGCTPYTRADRYLRALSAAKEAAAELEGLHKAGVVPRGSQDILEMVKKEIEELEGE